MKYRKKPVVIDAVQWLRTKKSWDEIHEMGSFDWVGGEMGTDTFFIKTLEGNMKVMPDDWIIKGVNGEFYPCKPDIFEKTYEAASALPENKEDEERQLRKVKAVIADMLEKGLVDSLYHKKVLMNFISPVKKPI